jgi:TfoX/Sxy family transcriptional regulator of competence genes
MAYDEILATRIRAVLGRSKGVAEKKMFGGLGYLLHGNMLVGIWHDALIVRLGPEEAAQALAEPHVREFDVTGRPMQGWAMVEPEGIARDEDLRGWIDRARRFVGALPAKAKK